MGELPEKILKNSENSETPSPNPENSKKILRNPISLTMMKFAMLSLLVGTLHAASVTSDLLAAQTACDEASVAYEKKPNRDTGEAMKHAYKTLTDAISAKKKEGHMKFSLLPLQAAQAVYQKAQVVYIKHRYDFNEKDMLAKKERVEEIKSRCHRISQEINKERMRFHRYH